MLVCVALYADNTLKENSIRALGVMALLNPITGD